MRALHRAAALGAGGLLVLGLAQAPASADPGVPWAQVRQWAASVDPPDRGGDEDDDSVRSPLRRWAAPDPRGDAERGRYVVLRGPRSYVRLADLTGVAYRTPSRAGGDLVVRSRWADLRDARRPGVRRQSFFVLLQERDGERAWIVGAMNFRDGVFASRIDRDGQVDVVPELASVRRVFGPGGTITITVSSEWLDVARVDAVSASFSRRAVDRSRYSPLLDMGPLRG